MISKDRQIKIYYLTQMNFMSGRAHVYNITKTCEALNALPNCRVTLVSTDNSLRTDKARDEFFNKHQVKEEFKIVSLNSLSCFLKNSKFRLVNWLMVVFVNFSLIKFVFKERKQIDVIYFRDHLLLFPILINKYIFKKPVFYESHYVLTRKHGQFLTNLCIKIADGVIAISYALKDYYKKLNNNIIVSFCGAAESERFASIKENRNELRKMLDLPIDKYIVGYTGNISFTGNYDPYGVDDIVRSLKFLSQDIILVLVGERKNDGEFLRDIVRNLGAEDRLIIRPWQKREDVPKYLISFDVLVIPKAGAKAGNSPTKTFEYLAAKRPIVAANTAAIREVMFDGHNALIVKTNTPREWAKKIIRVKNNNELRDKLIKQAFLDAKKYTWEKRVKSILDFIKNY